MARSRHELDVELRKLCNNVYYQPPSRGMNYPCILYSLVGKEAQFADNIRYLPFNQYDIKVITHNPDEPMVDQMLDAFENISFDRPYKADNLYHFVFTLYF